MQRKRSSEPELTYHIGADWVTSHKVGGELCRYHTRWEAAVWSKCSADGVLEPPGETVEINKDHPNEVIYLKIIITTVSATISYVLHILKGKQGNKESL